MILSIVKNQKHTDTGQSEQVLPTALEQRQSKVALSNCLELLHLGEVWVGVFSLEDDQGLLVRKATQDSGYSPTGMEVIQYFDNFYSSTDLTVCIALCPRHRVT